MKKASILVPIVSSGLLLWFMLFAPYGFMQLINDALLSLDYYLSWSLTIGEVALVAGTPWLTWALLPSNDRTPLKQMGLNLAFLVSALVFFTFGFLLLSMQPNINPLLPDYAKVQPFDLYWAIWFALGDLLILVFFLLNKRYRDENTTIDR